MEDAPVRKLEAYLHFDSNCREVLDFYRSVFAWDDLILQTFGDGPPEMGIPESDHHKTMHVTLKIGDGILMGCFGVPASVHTRIASGSTDNSTVTYPGRDAERLPVYPG